MTKYVRNFVEGHRDLKDLLGGKGANLAEMTRMGLPVRGTATSAPVRVPAWRSPASRPPGAAGVYGDYLAAVADDRDGPDSR